MDIDLLSARERLELLTAYLDGELDDATALDVTGWLDRHPEALREIEHQRRLWDLLGRYGDEPVPAGFARRVLDAAGAGSVQATPGKGSAPRATVSPPTVLPPTGLPPRWRRTWSLAAAAAALFAVGVGAAALLRSRAEPTTAGPLATLASIDVEFVQNAPLDDLLALSDAEFEALLTEDPDTLADAGLGG